VENLDKSVEKAKSLGATIKVPQTPVSDFGRFAVIIDPTGAYFALWQSLKS
jgi:predicted enzyme related to lactoylglutathione lyase